jgi:hypothetical protein
MKIILIILHAGLIFFVLYRFWTRQESEIKKYFLPAVILKIIAGIGVGLLYANYYHTGDTLNYFADGKILSALAKHDAGSYVRFLWNGDGDALSNLKLSDSRAIFFTKFVSILCLLTGDQYWVSATYFSLLCFFGAWFLFKKIQAWFPGTTIPAFVAFFLFPSIVFWTSGLIKESLACGALFYLTGVFLEAWFVHKVTIRQSLLAVPALWILWALKYYYAAIFLPVVFTCLMYKFLFTPFLKPSSKGYALFLWLLIFICPLIVVSFAHPNFYFHRFLEVIVSNNEIYNASSEPNDLIQFSDLKPEVLSIMRNAPAALFAGLFRPTLLEGDNTIQRIAGMENLFLLFLFTSSLMNTKKLFDGSNRVLVFGVLVYVVLLCVFITLSTPNFGTLSRYRVGYLPYFVFLTLCNNPVILFAQRSWSHLVP